MQTAIGQRRQGNAKCYTRDNIIFTFAQGASSFEGRLPCAPPNWTPQISICAFLAGVLEEAG